MLTYKTNSNNGPNFGGRSFGNIVNYQMNFIYERQVVTKLKFDIYY